MSFLAHIRSIAPETPLEASSQLSQKLWVDVFIKREDKWPIWSYKWRGAGNAILSLTPEERWNGVVCASAGNHAQWVALVWNKLRIPSTIVMPRTTPTAKIEWVKRFWWDGVNIILAGDTFDEAFQKAQEIQWETWAKFIHPFDSDEVVLWQSTVGFEIFEQMRQYERTTSLILTWVGGGGLLAGLVHAREYIWAEQTKIIWVEPKNAPSLTEALRNGSPFSIHTGETIADWARVAKVWQRWFDAYKNTWEEVILSPEWRLCQTVLELFERSPNERIVVEWAGALWVDGLKSLDSETIERIKKNKWAIVVIVSGGNIDPNTYHTIVERRDRFERRKIDIRVTFPQRPHALAEFNENLPEWVDIKQMQYNERDASQFWSANFTLWFRDTGSYHTFMSKFWSAPHIEFVEPEGIF